jgi:hypothetical protein
MNQNILNRKSLRNAPHMKILLLLNDLKLRHKWDELKFAMNAYSNKNLTRFYVQSYWKFTFLLLTRQFPHSADKVPQFIDCLSALNIDNKNEAVYSIVYLLLSENYFKEGIDLLQMVLF